METMLTSMLKPSFRDEYCRSLIGGRDKFIFVLLQQDFMNIFEDQFSLECQEKVLTRTKDQKECQFKNETSPRSW